MGIIAVGKNTRKGQSHTSRLPLTLATLAAFRSQLFLTPNVSLFRYLSMRDDRSWELLEYTVLNHKIPLTSPISFNDPFDSNPVVINDASFEEIAHVVDDSEFPLATTDVVDDSGRLLTDEEKQANLIKTIGEVLIGRNGPKMASFCRRISSQLLWSHYANSYRGLAYHFAFTGASVKNIRPVEYQRQRPIILVSEMLNQFNMLDAEATEENASAIMTNQFIFDQKAFLTKSIEWAYEEEERMLLRASEASFEPHELPSIIVGPRFSDENLTRLKEIVDRRSRPLRLYRANLAESDYAIEIDWVNPI